ncbi:rhodanese-like domain-containing protein [uncultured Polaribacter sp.]|uniref:rhodanese-like domain-containing protein n=1 Tax=uncultured Polaribacter sp. TaxID=174711 RepID=UPI0026066795|nr:rhodanese-like domain-containing protein [uncultured Polaribacter sp.]
MIKKTIAIIIFFISFSCYPQKNENVFIIDYKEIKESVIGKEVQLIDLRTDKEYKGGFIDDAVQMNFLDTANFLKQIEKLDKNKPIYIYCHSGGRSSRASKLLSKKGFTKIYDFSGGYKSWQKNNKK